MVYTAAWQSQGAATPAHGARAFLQPLLAQSLAHPFGRLQTLLWLSVWSHQWGAPAGSVQDREGSAEVVICLADSSATLDWLYLTSF